MSFNIEDLYNAQLPANYGNHHRASSVVLEKAQLEKLNEISACYEKYESILGQVPFDKYKSSLVFESVFLPFLRAPLRNEESSLMCSRSCWRHCIITITHSR